MNEILEFTIEQNMKINQHKSKLIVLNMTKNWQFSHEMGFMNEQILECVREAKILGIVISDNLKWLQNTKFITKKAMSRLWFLRQMKNLGPSNNVIFDVYYTSK